MPSCADRHRLVRGGLLALALLLAGAALPAQTSNPAELYKEALAREALLRKELDAHAAGGPAAPLLRRVRVLTGAYEDLARLFPASGYSDNALWQGARLAADVYDRFGEALDRVTALRLLNGLTTRFPTSSLAKEVPAQIARLTDPAPPPAQPSPPPRAATLTPPQAPVAAPPAAAPRARAAVSSSPVLLKAIRREVLAETLRMTLELEREVQFRDERLDGPPRVFIDLSNTRAADDLKDATIPFPDDVVKQVRVGRQLDSRTRVVFDLTASGKYSVFALYNPYRIVVDFERAARRPAPPATHETRTPARENSSGRASGGGATPAVSSPAAPRPPLAKSDSVFSLSRQLGLGVARIAIDPGHGGHDPGAEGNGLTEADLVLDVALRLEALLQHDHDVEVVLTRRTNAYVPLEERTAMANTSGADLFLSIHANASAAASARGIETYFLNFAPNAEAEAIAARENTGSTRSMGELPDIVHAIAMNNKLAESRDFATIVQATLHERLRTVNRNLRNLGVKQAPFMVLIGASMPSILTEISFMSNRQEATLLKTEKYRQQIAEALLAGILRYQESLTTFPAVASTR